MPKKKTHEEFVREVHDTTSNEYTVLGKYISNMKKVLIRHNICGNEWEISRANFINHNKRCPKCKFENLSKMFSKSHDDFVKDVYSLYDEEYEVLSKYEHSHKKITVKHRECNCEYEVEPTNLLSKKKCPICKFNKIGDMKRKGLEQFKKDVFKKVGDEYGIIGDYRNNKTNILIRHNCGYTYEGTPDNFLRGNRCPKCSSSKGENSIHEYLLKNDIEYKSQYKLKDCKYKDALPFDFAIFKNGNLKFLLEYDGIQHFEAIDYFGGEKEFELTKIRDQIKNEYCLKNNINLVRIPYWNFENIESILDDLF